MKQTIIIDSREQTPWSFPAHIKTKVAKINAGDYALENDLNFAIERKEKNDFLGTISKGWHRFCKELKRMENNNFVAKIIIVECDFNDFCFSEHNNKVIPPNNEHYMLTPQFIIKRIAELSLNNVSVLFASDALKASALAYAIFKERSKDLEK